MTEQEYEENVGKLIEDYEDDEEYLCVCNECFNQADNDCNEPKSKHYGENVDGLVVCCPYCLSKIEEVYERTY